MNNPSYRILSTADKRGFSLLEVAVVLVIIGGIIAIAAPRLFDKRSDTRKVFRDFIIAGKDLKSRAKLGGVTYRLAFDLGETAEENSPQSWWVEKASSSVVLDKEKMEKENEERGRDNGGSGDEAPPPPQFQPDTSIFRKKQTLPSGYRFKQVESGTLDMTVTEGMAYIHFFPQGLIETSALQIEDPKKTVWTLVYNPLTGRSDVIPEAKGLKDLAR